MAVYQFIYISIGMLYKMESSGKVPIMLIKTQTDVHLGDGNIIFLKILMREFMGKL